MSLIDKKKVEEVLNSIRPYLQADEGDIELVNITENGIVEVKLLGACNECPLSVMTLRAGVERTLIKEIPDIKRVESINYTMEKNEKVHHCRKLEDEYEFICCK